MKKQLIIFLGLLPGLFGLARAQSPQGVDDLYQRYSSGEGVFAMSLNHDMLDAIDIDFDWQDQMKNVTGDIHRVKFIAFGEESNPMKALQRMGRELGQTGLHQIEPPQDADLDDLKFFKLYGERHGSYYKNVYLLVVADDGRHGLFLAINGKLKITRTS